MLGFFIPGFEEAKIVFFQITKKDWLAKPQKRKAAKPQSGRVQDGTAMLWQYRLLVIAF
jgi:hypothetical protein